MAAATAAATTRDFVARALSQQRRLALITSGGTRVDLEQNAVRFLDNFSSGQRGAVSAENLVKRGYSVIFYHREGSLKPFIRHATNLFDRLTVDDNNRAYVDVDATLATAIRDAAAYRPYILYQTFATVADYLDGLSALSRHLRPADASALVYLAAAVSDFYVRDENVPTHKIDSAGGDLQLQLSAVPKTLGRVLAEDAPHAFVVSFKLETDAEKLLVKARRALERYRHHLVIANMLHTRKTTVTLVAPDGDAQPITLSAQEQAAGFDIEAHIIARLAELHAAHIAAAAK